ncbi:LysR substrate-binding domain-containing protein [Halalkalibacterium ligniniphilum]|uniref:LysR substrate-binding domain-containing protein n=1 Tax=Halalkalibacterium ligniniphilum TaxID=1134413 RepID=UPI000349A3D9|nr:LysR substrate-binding domain-containing protein [Halalkalibacterium ligniniphilum]
MELRHLRYFVTVAEELHFGKAAERLHIAQPPLSKQIKDLEKELGVSLFNRTNRKVELTLAGMLFLEEARKLQAQLEHAQNVARWAHRGEVGSLVLAFIGSANYDLIPLMKGYRKRFPKVDITLSQMLTPNQMEGLSKGTIDIGIMRPPSTNDELNFETIRREPWVAALPEGHPLLELGEPLPLYALKDMPIILYPRNLVGPRFYDAIMKLCYDAGFSPNIVYEAPEMQTTVALAASELGIALVPYSIQFLFNKGVVFRMLDDQTPSAEIGVAWRKEETSPLVHSFLSFCREVSVLQEVQNSHGMAWEEHEDKA